jgi:hypothetical protein
LRKRYARNPTLQIRNNSDFTHECISLSLNRDSSKCPKDLGPLGEVIKLGIDVHIEKYVVVMNEIIRGQALWFVVVVHSSACLLHVDFFKRLHDDKAFAFELHWDAFAAAAAEEGFERDVFAELWLQVT